MTNAEKILNISKRLGLSHISSNLSCLPILEEIYAKKKPEDLVILDNAHAHLAHLVVQHDGGELWQELCKGKILAHGIHCDRKAGCDASGGSLGHGIGIGIGYAIANPDKTIYVIVSDGSMMEGSNWEALRILDSLGIENLRIYCNFNGFTAVSESDSGDLENKMAMFHDDIEFRHTDNTEGFAGVQGHYKVL